MKDVKLNVLAIIETLENGYQVNEDGNQWDHDHDCECGLSESECECEKRELSGFDYIQDVLDINWILDSDREYKGARILVAFGGPNIWIDTTSNTVEGHWWSDSYTDRYVDNIGLDDAMRELWECQ